MPLPMTWSDLWRITDYGSQAGFPTNAPVEFPAIPSEGFGPGLAFGMVDNGGAGTDITGTNHGTASNEVGTSNEFTAWPLLGSTAGGLPSGLLATATDPGGVRFAGQDFDSVNGRWFWATGVATNVGPGGAQVPTGPCPWGLIVGNAAGGYSVNQAQAFTADLLSRSWPFVGLGGAGFRQPPRQVIYRPNTNSALIIATASETVGGTSYARVLFQSLSLASSTWGALKQILPGTTADLYLVQAIKDASDLVHVFVRDMSNFPNAGTGALYHVAIGTDDSIGAIGVIDRLQLDASYGTYPHGFGCAWSAGVVLPYVLETTSGRGCARLAYFPSDQVTTQPVIINMPMLNTADPPDLTVWQLGMAVSTPSVNLRVGVPCTTVNKNGSLYLFSVADSLLTRSVVWNDGVWMARYTGDAGFRTPNWTGYVRWYARTWDRVGCCWASYLPTRGQIGIVIVDSDRSVHYGTPAGSGSVVYYMPQAFRYIDNEPLLTDYPAAVFGDCPPTASMRGRAFAQIIG